MTAFFIAFIFGQLLVTVVVVWITRDKDATAIRFKRIMDIFGKR